jgi:hypothetical protein
MKQRSLITVNLSDCKNWKECMNVMDSITSGRVKINVDKINKENGIKKNRRLY